MPVTERSKPMRGKILGWLVQALPWSLAAAMALIAALAPAFAIDPSPQSEEQKQTGQDRCKFLMEKVRGIILSLSREGEISFLNHYGQTFFGYSDKEILGKPMLCTLTLLTGSGGRILATFWAQFARTRNGNPSSFNENRLRKADRVPLSGATQGISAARARCGRFSGWAWILLRENFD